MECQIFGDESVQRSVESKIQELKRKSSRGLDRGFEGVEEYKILEELLQLSVGSKIQELGRKSSRELDRGFERVKYKISGEEHL